MNTIKEIAEMACGIDGNGNIIYQQNGKFFIKLKDKTAFIGHVRMVKGRVKLVKTIKKENMFRVKNSFSFNHKLLHSIRDGDIVVKTPDNIYTIDINKAKALGTKLNFHNMGYELQVFVEIKHFTKHFDNGDSDDGETETAS